MTDTPTGSDERPEAEQPEAEETTAQILGDHLERIRELTDQFSSSYVEARLQEILERVDADDDDRSDAPASPAGCDIADMHITDISEVIVPDAPAHVTPSPAEASWQEDVLAAARGEADEIIAAARRRAGQIEDAALDTANEIVNQARASADDILRQAQDKAAQNRAQHPSTNQALQTTDPHWVSSALAQVIARMMGDPRAPGAGLAVIAVSDNLARPEGGGRIVVVEDFDPPDDHEAYSAWGALLLVHRSHLPKLYLHSSVPAHEGATEHPRQGALPITPTT